MNEENKQYISEFLIYFKEYVENLAYVNNTNNTNNEYLLKSQRKTGFLGLIIYLTNLLKLYEILKPYILYLLSYKISQDHLEVLFSAMRSRGFNNNPNAIQFRSVYKRLLVRHEINGSEFGNCTLLNSSTILYVSANKRTDADEIFNFNDNDESQYFDEFDHDYEYQRPSLEDYVVDVVKYTSGFIVRKIKRQKNICTICESQLIDENNESISLLLKIKNKGRLINTSADVQKICLATEHVIRMNNHLILTKKSISQYLCIKSMNEVSFETSIFNSDIMKNHILDQDVINSHRSQLIHLIIRHYVTIRLHHFAKMHTLSITKKNIRRNMTKLILFKNFISLMLYCINCIIRIFIFI